MASKKSGEEVLGKGMARKAAEALKDDKKKKMSKLSIIMGEIKKTRGSK